MVRIRLNQNDGVGRWRWLHIPRPVQIARSLTEVVDWRRFGSARAFMGFTGLVSSEYSAGERTHQGPITKAGSQRLFGESPFRDRGDFGEGYANSPGS
jgi:hypothetical protein